VRRIFPRSLRSARVVRRTIICFGSFARVGLFGFLLLLAHDVLAEVLPESSALEAFDIFVEDGPQRPTYRPIPGHLPEDRRCAEDMPNTVHPRRFTTLVVWIYDGNEVVNFLQRKPVLSRRQDSLANKSRI
jgi:hypothetical protein